MILFHVDSVESEIGKNYRMDWTSEIRGTFSGHGQR